MPISATGGKTARSGDRGFTLVELMIVLALFGLMSAIVVLAVPDPRGRLRTDAERLAARVLAARDRAVIGGRDMRLMIDPLGYGFEERHRESWEASREKPFRRTEWGTGTRIVIGRDVRGSVAFDSTGMPSEAMTIELRRDGEAVPVHIGQNGAVRVGS